MKRDTEQNTRISLWDVFYFTLIILYAVFVYIGCNVIKCEHKLPFSGIPCYPDLILIVVSLFIYGLLYYYILTATNTELNDGLCFGRGFWISLGIVLIFGLIAFEKQAFSGGLLVGLLPSTIFLLSCEIIFRMLLINQIYRISHKHKYTYYFAIILSGLIFIFVREPILDTSLPIIIMSIMLSMLYIWSRSLIAVLFFDIIFYLPGSESMGQYGFILMAGFVSLVLYSLVSIPKFLIHRKMLD
ncbi:MAG: CPBP family glutamic-type intramembrane protease [Candidatus Zixiibacteriota bacterium]